MPFTFAHPAAVLPLAHTRLVFSALVVGSIAPDFEYFLRLSATSNVSHTPLGALLFCLPVALVVLWIVQRFLREPLLHVLPSGMRHKLSPAPRFNFGPPSRFVIIAVSMLVGIASHLVWDSFTHPSDWAVRHWNFLNLPVITTPFGIVQVYKILQHGSTVVGMAAVAFFIWRRWSSIPSNGQVGDASSVDKREAHARLTLAALVGAAGCGGLTCGIIAGPPLSYSTATTILARTVVVLISATWVALMVYGLIWHRVFAPVRKKSADLAM